MSESPQETPGDPWPVEIDPPAERDLGRITERIVLPLIEFIYGGLAENPERRGKPLRGELEGLWSARRGDYRVLYSLDEETGTLHIVRITGRADAYRPVTRKKPAKKR